MKTTNTRNPFLVGIKSGIQAILISICCSPMIVFIELFTDAMERNVEYWPAGGISFEILCLGGLTIILLWFSLPYLLGEIVLAFLMLHLKSKSKVLLSRVIIGLIAGIIGNWLMVIFFLALPLKDLRVSDWVLIGMMEIWSVGIFLWVGFQANGNLTLGRRKSDI